MKGIVLGLMLMTQACYGVESKGMHYLNGLCNMLGGQGYNCSEDGPVCCQHMIGHAAYFVAISTVVIGQLFISKCCRTKRKPAADVIPLPKALSENKIKKIEAGNRLTPVELLKRRN